MNTLSQAQNSLLPETITEMRRNRRKIHAHPELAFCERKTGQLVEEHLKRLGFQPETGIAETGIVCLIDSGKPGKTLLIRADMDALPIKEQNQVDYQSQNPGVMHACGHDGHTAILMSLATELKQNGPAILPSGKVLLVFQPAEEGHGGADRMIAEGLLQKYAVDAAFALHVWNHIEVGKIGVVDGTMMASVDEFIIKISGRGGHGAMPQHTIDPVVIAAHLVTALQTLVSRNIDPFEPCVITVASIHTGDAFNVIPAHAVMNGTIRTFSKEVHRMIPEKFQKLVTAIVESFGALVEIEYKRINRPTINQSQMVEWVTQAAEQVLGDGCLAEEHTRTMGGEDFSAFLHQVPGCYFFVGSRNAEKGYIHSHHHAQFDFDEQAMTSGLMVLKQLIYNFLSNP